MFGLLKKQHYTAANMPSTTMDEKVLTSLIREALFIADDAAKPHEIKQSLYELGELRRHLELRAEEQTLRFERIGLPRVDILDYKQAVHVLRSQIEQAVMELQHKEYVQ
jgi:hypothetical protein